MTFGIDVSMWQAGIDMARAKADGTEFVIVKAVAADEPEHTVAVGYHDHIDAVIAQELPKGHYLVINSQNTPHESAGFLASNLYKYTRGDVLALDNEPLNRYATFWKQDDCVTFFKDLHEMTGHPYERMWLYCPAHLSRQNGPYTKVEALGVKIWWVSYGDMDSEREDGEEPYLGTAVSQWHIHQYSSTVPIAGKRVDGNYSPHPVEELFGPTGGEPMALKNYTLQEPSTVIFVDKRDPYVSWANHIKRTWYSGKRGGVDIVALTPVPVIARTAGTMVQVPNDGGAGHSSRFFHRDNPGWKDVFSHLSSYRTPKNPQGLNGFKYEAGDIIAYTGATGGVAPHLHWHLLDPNNIRRNPWDYFTPESELSGGDKTPIDNTNDQEQEEEEEMAKNSGVYWKRADGTYEYMVFNTGSGFRANHGGVTGAYNDSLAGALDTPSWALVTEAHAKVLIRSLDALRSTAVSGSLSVEIDPADIPSNA